jgi:polyvinyl alcohol dehydrogenase (cytochrome)
MDTAHTFTDGRQRRTIDAVAPIPAGTDLPVNSGFDTFGRANQFQGGPGNALFIFRLAV